MARVDGQVFPGLAGILAGVDIAELAEGLAPLRRVAAAAGRLGPAAPEVPPVARPVVVGAARVVVLAGPKFSMADISYMPYFHQFDALGIAELRDDRPNLKAWWATVSTMPNWAYATSGKVATEKVAKAA